MTSSQINNRKSSRLELCRICLKATTKNDLIPLFNDEQLSHRIETISSVKIVQEDNLPNMVCTRCVLNINLSFRFRLLVINNDLKLHQDPEHIIHNASNFQDGKKTLKTEENQTDDNLPATNGCIKSEIFEPPKDDFGLDQRLHKCKKCDFQTKSYEEILYHRRSSHKPTVVCSVCGKIVLAENMRTHIVTHYHSPIACPICGNIQKHEVSLRSHMRYHKEAQKVCHICGQIYRHPSRFKLHMRRHTTPRERKYHCHICSKSLTDKKTLESHIRSHTGERPFPCEYCKKGFSSKNALVTHIRQHTKEKPYACSICSMTFRQRVSARTHIKSKHSCDAPVLRVPASKGMV